MTSGFESSPLISVEELVEEMDRQDIKIFDVRGSWGGDPEKARAEYTHSHIPGAVLIDWTSQFIKPGVPIHLAPVASKEDARRCFEELGIRDGDTVILYDDYHHMLAGRIWWAMRYWGFSKVKVLNGGWRQWCARGFAVSSEPVEVSQGSFEPVRHETLRVSLASLIETKDGINLVDSRGPIGFKGNDEDTRSGHIPGALNIPYSDVLDSETGLFKSAAELEALFHAELPDFRTTPIVSSCGAGYAGTVTLLALAIIGVDAPLFDGSFSVWKANEHLPIEKGE